MEHSLKVEEKDVVKNLFPNDEVGLYHNESELIDDALQYDKSAQSKRAMEFVLQNHPFKII